MAASLIELSRLENNETQTRDHLRPEAIDDYCALIVAGVELDPGLAFDDGTRLYLASGFHRREAFRKAGRDAMPCEVKGGTRLDAIKEGVKDNKKHGGERLSNADKRRSIDLVLRESPLESNQTVGKWCGVDHKTVEARRRQLTESGEIPTSDHRTRSDGRSYRVADPKFRDEPIASAMGTRLDRGDCPAPHATLDGETAEQFSDTAAVNTPKQHGDTFKPDDFYSPVKSEDGSPVPEALRQVFEVAPEFDEQRHKLTAIKSWMTHRRKHPAGSRLHAAYERLRTDIDNADRELKFSRPYCACPYCKGEPPTLACNACKGTGWITQLQFGNVPPELKEGVVFAPKRSGGKSAPSTTPSDPFEDAELIVAQLENALAAVNDAHPDTGMFEAVKQGTCALAVLLDDWRKAAAL